MGKTLCTLVAAAFFLFSSRPVNLPDRDLHIRAYYIAEHDAMLRKDTTIFFETYPKSEAAGRLMQLLQISIGVYNDMAFQAAEAGNSRQKKMYQELAARSYELLNILSANGLDTYLKSLGGQK